MARDTHTHTHSHIRVYDYILSSQYYPTQLYKRVGLQVDVIGVNVYICASAYRFENSGDLWG